MSAAWLKAVRELRKERMRAALAVLAIAVGLAALLACLSAYDILVRELNRGYLATQPASAVLRTGAIDDALLAQVRADPGVAAAELRGYASGRVKAGPMQWRNLVLFVVPDFTRQQVAKIAPQAGAWPPAQGEILVERDAMQVAQARIGDVLTVRTAAGEESTLRLAGTVKDVGQAQARMEQLVYGYVTPATAGSLHDARLLLRTRADAAAVAGRIKELLESHGHPVRRVDLPDPTRHPHADLTGLLLLSLATFAAFVLLLSGTLVANLVTSWMAAQVRQIGVMKALGASRAQVARIYLLQSFLLGLAAAALALWPGLLAGRAICRAMAAFLNFDVESFAVAGWVFAAMAVAGLLVPLVSAAAPVARAAAVPVREALSDFGVTAPARALAAIPGAPAPLQLALRNALRRRRRLLATLLPLTLGGLFFISALHVRASFIHTIDNLFARRKFDVWLALGGMASADEVERAVRAVPEIGRSELWIATEASFAEPGAAAPPAQSGLHGASAPIGADRFPVLAIPPDTPMLDLQIVRGRALKAGDSNALVISSALAAERRLSPGAKIKLRIGPSLREWEVVGISREPFSPALGYISRAWLDKVGEHAGSGNALRLSVPRGDLSAVRAALDRALEREGVLALASGSKAEMRRGFDEHMRMVYVMLVVLAGILAAVGALGLGTTMSIAVLERRRELGVLRALGGTPRAVAALVVVEGAALALVAWAVASLLAWPVSRIAGGAIVAHAFRSGMDFTFEGRGIVAWLTVSIAAAVAASLWPAVRAGRAPVRDALACE